MYLSEQWQARYKHWIVHLYILYYWLWSSTYTYYIISYYTLLLSCSVFATSWTVARQLLCPRGFSRQEYWSGLPCLPSGDLPDTGIKPGCPALQVDSLLSEPAGKPTASIHTYMQLLCMFVCGERVCDEDAMEDVAKELARLDQPQFDPKLWKELKSIPSKSREFLEKTELSVLRPEEIQQWCVKTFWFLFYWPLETRLEFSGNQTFLTSRRVVPFRLTRSSLRVWAACSAQMWMHGDRRLATPESRSLKSQPRQNTRFLTLKKGSMPPRNIR